MADAPLHPDGDGSFELKYPTWQKAYQAAMTETDDSRLRQKILEAEEAITGRSTWLSDGGSHDAAAEELIAIHDALVGLNVLRKELDGKTQL
jgi:hypothetical protein